MANNTGTHLNVVFEQVWGSRSTPDLGSWLLPYPGKTSMRLDRAVFVGLEKKVDPEMFLE